MAELPRPGDSAFIYLVPTGLGTSNDSYSEYLWVTESNDYEFIGTTADIDLSNYAQINGTYAGMTVGNATNAQTATNAQQLGGVAAANYAQTNGTYSGMTVGNATNADTADSATSAQDSAKLGGVAADQYALQSQLPVANPTATGTQDLTSLQVGGTVYNIPQGSGGITNAQVIEYAEQLPTATETSPNFVQTPDGTLYRKKAVEGGVAGVITSSTIKGVFNINYSPSVLDARVSQTINFSSNNEDFSSFFADFTRGETLQYGGTTVYNGSWTNSAYRTVNFGNEEQPVDGSFYDYFTQVATPVTPSVSYEYVAMQEVPTPTTADNGKVLGVTNGAYELQEASGGGTPLYKHEVFVDVYQLTFISNIPTQFTTIEQALNGLLAGISFNNMGSAKFGAYLGWFKDIGADTVSIVYTNTGNTVVYAQYNIGYSISDTVTPL